jgi:hypothetical protein
VAIVTGSGVRLSVLRLSAICQVLGRQQACLDSCVAAALWRVVEPGRTNDQAACRPMLVYQGDVQAACAWILVRAGRPFRSPFPTPISVPSFHAGHIRTKSAVPIALWQTCSAVKRLGNRALGCAASLPDPVRFSVVIEQGDLGTAREWLDNGLPPDFEGSVIGSGLMIGAWEGNMPMMELFHSRGADHQQGQPPGRAGAATCGVAGQLAAVRWLVERGANLNREGREWSALHYAVFAGHADVVAYLLLSAVPRSMPCPPTVRRR